MELTNEGNTGWINFGERRSIVGKVFRGVERHLAGAKL